MQSRRNFISHVATGLAGTLAASNVMAANDRVPHRHHRTGRPRTRDSAASPRPRKRGMRGCRRRLYQGTRRGQSHRSGAKTYLDHRRLLEDKDIDAVLIATRSTSIASTSPTL